MHVIELGAQPGTLYMSKYDPTCMYKTSYFFAEYKTSYFVLSYGCQNNHSRATAQKMKSQAGCFKTSVFYPHFHTSCWA